MTMRLIDAPVMEVFKDHIVLSVKLRKDEIESARRIIDKIQSSPRPERFAIDIRRINKRRSLDANAYYWVLVGEISKAVGSTDTEVHNMLLMDYGEPARDSDGSPKFILMEESDEYIRSIDYHLRPTDVTEIRNGKRYRWYVEMKGSRYYNTEEMSRLIDGAVQEARALGIETMTPAQIEEVKKRWGI